MNTDSKLPLQRVYHHAKTRPDVISLTQPMGGGKVEDFTWARLLDESKRMAAHLRSFNFPPKSQIAILSKNCAHFILTDLAIWMAGHVSVALYPTVGEKTIRYVLDHCDAKLLFVGKLDSWDQQKGAVPAGMPCISYPLSPPTNFPTWNDIIAKTAPIEGEPVRPADDLALIMYTSGSTGQPKGVMHSFHTMSAAAQGYIDEYNLNENDRMLSYLPLAHVFERALLETAGFLTGGRAYFAESLDTFIADLNRARPTVFISVPRLWVKFQQGVLKKMPEKKLKTLMKIPILSGIVKKKILKGLGLDSTRIAGSGSAPLPADVLQWYRDLGLELLEGYAMSENFAYSHSSKVGEARVGYVGTPMKGVQAKLTPEGEVLVKSPANMLGYFKEPALSKEAFTDDGFLKTGDRGELDDQGRLKITGRVKELFKTSKGKYVAPAPIENMINGDRHIELSCVAGSGHGSPHALVLLAEDHAKAADAPETKAQIAATLAALIERVNAELEEHEKLAFIAVVKDRWTIENGLLTPTMKIKRSTIEEAYAPHLTNWYSSKTRVIWS